MLFSETTIDIVDCIVCVKSAKPGALLVSFDKGLVKTRRRSSGRDEPGDAAG
ncbi:MAG: hypothetical protein ACOZF0_15035 [Thermodesulfobacteriota bacterium]